MNELRYGKLVIDVNRGVKHLRDKGKRCQRRKHVYAVCDCGNARWMRADSFKRGRSKTCGTCNRSQALVDTKIHSWTIKKVFVRNQQTVWLCECVCGKVKEVDPSAVRTGLSKSCGCNHNRNLDLTGEQFGHLMALERGPRGTWKCRCSCGGEDFFNTKLLLRGHTRSCGCINWKSLKHRQGNRREEETRANEISPEETELLNAVELYRRANKKRYIGPTDVLEILKKLGYRKVK